MIEKEANKAAREMALLSCKWICKECTTMCPTFNSALIYVRAGYKRENAREEVKPSPIISMLKNEKLIQGIKSGKGECSENS